MNVENARKWLENTGFCHFTVTKRSGKHPIFAHKVERENRDKVQMKEALATFDANVHLLEPGRYAIRAMMHDKAGPSLQELDFAIESETTAISGPPAQDITLLLKQQGEAFEARISAITKEWEHKAELQKKDEEIARLKEEAQSSKGWEPKASFLVGKLFSVLDEKGYISGFLGEPDPEKKSDDPGPTENPKQPTSPETEEDMMPRVSGLTEEQASALDQRVDQAFEGLAEKLKEQTPDLLETLASLSPEKLQKLAALSVEKVNSLPWNFL